MLTGSQAAAAIQDVMALQQGALDRVQDIDAILGRLDRIESALGISRESTSITAVSPKSDQDEEPEDSSLRPLWRAVKHLRKITRPDQDEAIWSRPVIKHLWHSYEISSIMSMPFM